jgi:hypothetical protein
MMHQQKGPLKTTAGQGGKVHRRELPHSLLSMVLAVTALALPQPAHVQTLEASSANQSAFLLTIQDELISLSAREASLKAIIEEIGRRMTIPVTVAIPDAVRVSLEFERLPLPEVLKQFGRYVNYAYVERREEGALRISSITIQSLKGAPHPVERGIDPSQPNDEQRPRARLDMTIDPSKHLRRQPQ